MFSKTLKGIRQPSVHVQQFHFLRDGVVFTVDVCEKNPSPLTL